MLLTSPDGSSTVSLDARAMFPADVPDASQPPAYVDDFPLLTGDGGGSQAPAEDVVLAAARSLRQPTSPLLTAFFSRDNLEALQRDLSAQVLERVGLDVGRQSDRELALVMRRVYAEAADPWRNEVADEVQRLNTLVLAGAVDTVARNVTRHLAYYEDSARPVAMPAPAEALTQPPFSSTPAPVPTPPENLEPW